MPRGGHVKSLVDPVADTIRVYRRGEAGFGRPMESAAASNDVATTPLLPGLEIPLTRVFA